MKRVKQFDPSSNKVPGTDWRILGELEFPVGAETNGMISTWLTEVLSPLDMHVDFLNRILKSAQDAAIRAFQAEAEIKLERLHLLIFVPPEHAPRDNTWGFFRIEKIENSPTGVARASHAIEFYLYMDG